MAVAAFQQQVESDTELLRCARNGDREAFGVLFARHRGRAAHAARGLARSRASSEDLVADTFARTWQAISNGHGPTETFVPYMLTVMRRVASEQWSHEAREAPVGRCPDSGASDSIDVGSALSDRMMVQRAFAALPERWQTVLWMAEVEGRSQSDMAATLGVSPNSVAMTAFRAREGMREAFLREHLRPARETGCSGVIEMMAAYVRDSLSSRDRVKVDRHLSGCAGCVALLGEARSVNATLKSVLLPAAFGVAGFGSWLARVRPRRGTGRSLRVAASGSVAVAVAVIVAAAGLVAALGDGSRGGVGGSAGTSAAADGPVNPGGGGVGPVDVEGLSGVPAGSTTTSVADVVTASTVVADVSGPAVDLTTTTVADISATIVEDMSTTTTVNDTAATAVNDTTTTTVNDTTTTTVNDTTTTTVNDTTTTTVNDTTTTTVNDTDTGCDLTMFAWCINLPF